MKSGSSKGFTLIELLVVVAIIGILATVVLASLGSARTRAQMAKVKGQMAQIPAAAEIYADTNGSAYAVGACANGTPTGFFLDATSGMNRLATGTNYPSGSALTCSSTTSAWGVQVTYNGTNFCVDSVTNSVKTGSTLTGQTCS